MHSNFLAQPKFHNEKYTTLDPYRDHTDYENQVDAQKIVTKQSQTVNSNPTMTIEQLPATARNKIRKRTKRSLLNHSMAKDMHNGKVDDSIFLMSDSFKYGVKAAYNTTNS